MPSLSEIGPLVMTSGALITSGLAVYYSRSNRNKIDSESGVNNASAKEIEERAATLSDERYRKREEFWSQENAKIKKEWHEDIEELRDEVAWLRILIENHVPWDWEQMRKMTLAGIEHDRPPTLNYVKRKRKEEEKDADET